MKYLKLYESFDNISNEFFESVQDAFIHIHDNYEFKIDRLTDITITIKVRIPLDNYFQFNDDIKQAVERCKNINDVNCYLDINHNNLVITVQKGSDKYCSECNGTKKISCDECGGACTEECHTCFGEGTDYCSSCGGDGVLFDMEHNESECPECNGAGVTTCSAGCNDGVFICDHCGGSGKKDCDQCDKRKPI